MDREQTEQLPATSDIGQRLRRWRRERGWTQAQLASKASVASGTISRIESGEARPLGRTARQLARALGVEEDRLLGLDGQPALFPLPDERRVALTRALLQLSDEDVERVYPALRAVIDGARTTRGRSGRAGKASR